LALLRSAKQALDEASMKHYGAAAQFRLGQLLGDSEGAMLLNAADTFFKQQAIVNVARVVNLLAPGRWPAPEVR
jgi:hypothetical protein